MAASRRSPNLSGKPNLRWTGLGPRVGEDPSHMKYSRGAQVGQAPGSPQYFIVRAATGDDWHAVLAKGDETAGSIIEQIGTGTSTDAYYYCVNHWHWGIASSNRRDPRRRTD
ncbi:MAG: hypothetical protein ACRDU0_14445 [Mycobacterium sp.]